MKSPVVVGVVIVLGVVGIGWYLTFAPSQPTAPATTLTDERLPTPTAAAVDQRAAFDIFTNGTFRVFTAAMYHNRSKDVYLDATNPNIIKIKKAGTTWNDFFKTLPFTLTHQCLTTGTKETFCTNNAKTLRFYLNGIRKESVLDEVINHRDKLLVSYGSEEEAVIAQQLGRIPNPNE